ncbi:MAG: hypothetical protein IT372_35925 [Polyangiaceae bacterium]|nr:hypothetical protein [Polyangiaceae bacterium]
MVGFASYEQRLVPEFTAESLPAAAIEVLGRIATLTTLRLRERQFDETALASEVRRASEGLNEWFESDEGAAWTEGPGAYERVGMTQFAVQLSSSLRVVVRS